MKKKTSATAPDQILPVVRYAGVALGGGKAERTAVCVLEYYPKQKRLFLRSLRESVKGENRTSADLKLHQVLTEEETNLHSIAFDVPLQLPKCITCRLRCPGYEKCKEPEIRWMWDHQKKRDEVKRPSKIFTPYTERCVEMYVASELEETFHLSHALGANAAPLTARAHFITRRLKTPLVEVAPQLSVWRIGRELHLNKSQLKLHRHSVEGDEVRLAFLKALMAKEIVFIYQQDLKAMVDHYQSFEAFVSALTAYLKHQGQCEKRPSGFPKTESWIAIPKEDFDWF